MRIVRVGEEAGECWMAKSSASLVVKVDHLGKKILLNAAKLLPPAKLTMVVYVGRYYHKHDEEWGEEGTSWPDLVRSGSKIPMRYALKSRASCCNL